MNQNCFYIHFSPNSQLHCLCGNYSYIYTWLYLVLYLEPSIVFSILSSHIALYSSAKFYNWCYIIEISPPIALHWTCSYPVRNYLESGWVGSVYKTRNPCLTQLNRVNTFSIQLLIGLKNFGSNRTIYGRFGSGWSVLPTRVHP